ncbi:MAG: hypothetical protein AAB911_01975 [Patescibacteria group bacterium]
MPYNKDRWFQFNASEQVGNIGSEVYRAFAWQKREDKIQAIQAAERSLELFDLTLADPRWPKINGRLKEIARAKEVFCSLFFGENEYNENTESLMKYFDEFALAARKDR